MSDAKRLKELEVDNTGLKKLLAESLFSDPHDDMGLELARLRKENEILRQVGLL